MITAICSEHGQCECYNTVQNSKLDSHPTCSGNQSYGYHEQYFWPGSRYDVTGSGVTLDNDNRSSMGHNPAYTNCDYSAVSNLSGLYDGSAIALSQLSDEQANQQGYLRGKEANLLNATENQAANWQHLNRVQPTNVQARDTLLPVSTLSMTISGSNYTASSASPTDDCGDAAKTASAAHERQVLTDSRLTRATNIQSTSASLSAYSTSSTCSKLPSDGDDSISTTQSKESAASNLTITTTKPIGQDDQTHFYTYNNRQEQLETLQQHSNNNGTQYNNNDMIVNHHHLNRVPLIDESRLNANISNGSPLNTTQSAVHNGQHQQLVVENQHVYPAVCGASELNTTQFTGYSNVEPTYGNNDANNIFNANRSNMAHLNSVQQRNGSTYCSSSQQQSVSMVENQVGVFEAYERPATGNKFSPSASMATSFEHHHSSSSPIKFPSQQLQGSSSTASSSSTSSNSAQLSSYDCHTTDRVGNANPWTSHPQSNNNAETMSSSITASLATDTNFNLFSQNESSQHYRQQNAQTGSFMPMMNPAFQPKHLGTNQPVKYQEYEQMSNTRYSEHLHPTLTHNLEGADYMMQSHRFDSSQPIENYSAAYHQKAFNQTSQFPITY